MCLNVVISPVISGPIILLIISAKAQNPNPKSQIPSPNPSRPVAVGIWGLGFGLWDFLYNGPDARRCPRPVGGPVPADHSDRQARGHGGARDDARPVPAGPPPPPLFAGRPGPAPPLSPRALGPPPFPRPPPP